VSDKNLARSTTVGLDMSCRSILGGGLGVSKIALLLVSQGGLRPFRRPLRAYIEARIRVLYGRVMTSTYYSALASAEELPRGTS
jgi:hypothetical protein